MKWVIIGLGAVVAANAALLFFALHSRPVLESEDYYADAVRFEDTLAERRASDALGWSAVVNVDGQIAYELTDERGRPVEGLSGELQVRRADTREHDATHVLEETVPGRYTAPAPLHAGLYSVDVRLEGGPAPWVDRRSVVR